MKKITVTYVTSSSYKREEVAEILRSISILADTQAPVVVGTIFDFNFVEARTDEPLERSLDIMVRHKAKSAYRSVLAPCIVEHAGLIFAGYEEQSYPGGLTQPMWDALGADSFIRSALWAGTRITARAVIGYCDGLRINTFSGETHGSLASAPQGDRQFYWDTIFCPDGGDGKTYAEISGEPSGLTHKVTLSQSTKAMTLFLEHIYTNRSKLFPDIR